MLQLLRQNAVDSLGTTELVMAATILLVANRKFPFGSYSGTLTRYKENSISNSITMIYM